MLNYGMLYFNNHGKMDNYVKLFFGSQTALHRIYISFNVTQQTFINV